MPRKEDEPLPPGVSESQNRKLKLQQHQEEQTKWHLQQQYHKKMSDYPDEWSNRLSRLDPAESGKKLTPNGARTNRPLMPANHFDRSMKTEFRPIGLSASPPLLPLIDSQTSKIPPPTMKEAWIGRQSRHRRYGRQEERRRRMEAAISAIMVASTTSAILTKHGNPSVFRAL
ncbi:unnamed protein product [Protopolystoma xenopodis]|uniref:Uncharacterized protein n=1 Tax=Protopolystoma xenopodis TaxID=117903 RepID=A0A3S5AHA4_9PLAT|nr:unnamed protein product [Protopolystoma xenopodis]